MGRKCSTLWDGTSCKSGYKNDPNNKKYKVIGFPNDSDEKKSWLDTLPNVIRLEDVTVNIGICLRHWPDNYDTKTVQGSSKRPLHPPSLFGSTSKTFFVQTATAMDRNVSERNLTADDRRAAAARRKHELDLAADTISSWEEFLTYCTSLNLAIQTSHNDVTLCKLDGMPPTVDFTINIDKHFKICAFKGNKRVSVEKCGRVTEGVVWHNIVTKYSDVNRIISKLSDMQVNIANELSHFGERMLQLLTECNTGLEDSKIRQMRFICQQLVVQDKIRLIGPQLGSLMQDAMDLF